MNLDDTRITLEHLEHVDEDGGSGMPRVYSPPSRARISGDRAGGDPGGPSTAVPAGYLTRRTPVAGAGARA